MSQYIDETASATQLLPTTRRAFVTIVVTAWIVSAGLLSWLVLDGGGLDSNFEMVLMTIPGIVFGFGGACLGAVIALLAGATLSRQFCWILLLFAGVFGVPAVYAIVIRTVFMLPNNMVASIFTSASGWMFSLGIPLTMLASLSASIVMGVILTRKRLGLGARSRRAVRITFPCALGGVALLAAIWTALKSSGFGPTMWPAMTMMLLAGATAVSCVHAVLVAEKPERNESLFEVLPVQNVKTGS